MRGGAGVGTRHQSHSTLSCVLWGRHEGARGGRLLPGCGASGVGQSPTPDCPPSGRAAGAHYPLAVGAGGCGRGEPAPTPQRALLRVGFAHSGGGMRVPGGGASCLGVGRPGSGALPPPTPPPLGGLPGPTTHWLWVRGGAGVGTRHQPHSARSCVLWGRHLGARGGRLLPGCGASGVGRSPTPDCPPFGRATGAHYPLAVGAGGCGRGDPSPTPQRALLRAGFARCGGDTRAPTGGAFCLGLGRPGSGALPPFDCPPSWRAAGAHFPLAVGARGCGRGDLLGGLPGPTTNRLWVRGAAGVGTRHQPHSALSCVLWGRHEVARGCPYASMWGSKWRDCLQMVPSNCVLNHMLIPWVSEVIYYCNYLEFGIIAFFDLILCSFLYFMCSTGRLTVKCLEICELWYVAYMLADASVLHLTICRITWSLWRGTRGLTKLGLKFMS